LRFEIEEGNEIYEGVLEDKVMEEIVFPLPIIEDETLHLISNMSDNVEARVEVFGQSNVA
jgi:hypothetical protein